LKLSGSDPGFPDNCLGWQGMSHSSIKRLVEYPQALEEN
jgi:hypothetical protein